MIFMRPETLNQYEAAAKSAALHPRLAWRAALRCQTPATVTCPPSLSPRHAAQARPPVRSQPHRHQPHSPPRTAGLTFPDPISTGTSLLRCTERQGFSFPGPFGHQELLGARPCSAQPLCSPRSEHGCRTHPRAAQHSRLCLAAAPVRAAVPSRRRLGASGPAARQTPTPRAALASRPLHSQHEPRDNTRALTQERDNERDDNDDETTINKW